MISQTEARSCATYHWLKGPSREKWVVPPATKSNVKKVRSDMKPIVARRCDSTSLPAAFVVVQPSLSHYREPFVSALLRSSYFRFDLAGRHGEAKASRYEPPKEASRELSERVLSLRRVRLVGPIFWDKALIKAAFESKAETVVLEGNIFGLSSWVAAILLRLCGRRVVFWGHGWKRTEKGAKLLLRKMFYALPHRHFLYGDRARRFAGAAGMDKGRFFPIYNSFMSGDEMTGVSKTPSPASSPRVLTLVFSGRLTERHAVHKAVEAVLISRREGNAVKLLVVGDGPERGKLEEQVLDDPDAVVFLGPLYGVEELREVYGEADFAVSPGASGLNVIQALGFAVPVIALDGHPHSGPEIEAVQHLRTGILYGEGKRSLAELLAILSRAEGWAFVVGMGEHALELARTRYSAEAHAKAFVDALEDLGSSRNLLHKPALPKCHRGRHEDRFHSR